MKNIAVYFFICVLFVSCERKRGFKIPDVSKPHEEVVGSREKHPSNIKIMITGETNGTFTLNGFPFFAGKIDTSFLVDHYADSIQMKYVPNKVTTGELKVYYSY